MRLCKMLGNTFPPNKVHRILWNLRWLYCGVFLVILFFQKMRSGGSVVIISYQNSVICTRQTFRPFYTHYHNGLPFVSAYWALPPHVFCDFSFTISCVSGKFLSDHSGINSGFLTDKLFFISTPSFVHEYSKNQLVKDVKCTKKGPTCYDTYRS